MTVSQAGPPVNRCYRSDDAPPSFVAGKRDTSWRSILITVSRPAECTCPMRRKPALVSSIIPSSWTTKSRPGSRGRQPGTALARHKSKCAQGATTEISRRSLSASAIALAQADSAPRAYSSSFVDTHPFCASRSGLALLWDPYSRPLVIARPPSLSSNAPKGPRVKKAAPPRHCRRPPAHASSSQPSCCSAVSTARAKRGYNCGLLERRLDDGASSPLIIHVFDVADQITDDFYLVDILVRDFDVREPIFDNDH